MRDGVRAYSAFHRSGGIATRLLRNDPNKRRASLIPDDRYRRAGPAPVWVRLVVNGDGGAALPKLGVVIGCR